MEYEIIVKKRTPYAVKETVYEAEDGKRYYSSYNEKLKDQKYKQKEYKTGATGFSETELYSQKVDSLDLATVIKAINNII